MILILVLTVLYLLEEASREGRLFTEHPVELAAVGPSD